MDDFEFSVDISDRDWQCFFTQCEECNVLPPSLAGLEESGMSDMDDLGARFAKKVQKSDVNTVCLLEEDEPAGSPRDGPAEELCPGRLSSGGIESVLSGSEEDIHLQSVNMFFEQMKSSSDSKKRAQLGQVGAIQKPSVQGEKRGGVQLARCTDHALPKNVLCSGSARGGAAGSKTTGAVGTSRHTYSVRTEESSSESSTSLYIMHPYLKTQLHIETSSENTTNEHERAMRTDRSTPHSNIMYKVKDHSTHRKTSDVNIHPDPVMSMKWTEDKSIQVSHSDTDSNPRHFSKQSSPSTSVKRKRRKKRRLSAEPAGNLFTCERLYDSEDELFTWRRAIDPCFCNWSGLKHQHLKCEFMPPLGHYTLSSSLPARVKVKENQLSPEHHQHQSVLTQAHFDPSSLTRIWPGTDYAVKQDSIKYNIETNGSTADDMELTKLNEDTKVNATHLETFAPSDTYRNEVRSITHSIFPNAESNGQRLAMGQSDRGSTAKSVMREEEDETNQVSRCQRETGPPHLRSHTVENMTPPPRKTATSISTVTDLLDCKTRRQDSQSSYTASGEASATLHNLSPVSSDLFVDVQKSRCCRDDAKLQNLPTKHEMTEVCETEKPQEVEEIESENMDQTSELREISEIQSRSTSVSTLSSCNTPESEPLPNENTSQTLESALIQNGLSSHEENVQIITKDGKVEPVSQNDVKHLQEEVEEPCWDQVEVAMTNSKSEERDEAAVESDHPVFTMSSFWKEMEKVTINDILGLRNESKASSSFLPTLQEVDDPDCFALSDLSCCTQVEERKSKDKDTRSTIQRPADSTLCVNNATSRGVQWENESVPKSLTPENVYNDKISSIPLVAPDVSRGLRRMSKNISVQNLHTLESELFCCNRNSQTMLKQFSQDVHDDPGYLPEDPPPKRKPRPSSMIENFRFSISDIYSYFFSEKQPNSSFESPTEDILDNFINGDSVPENYDHFFSEFDTDTFFYTEESKPELVPIFSCSRSSKSKMKLRDGYDYFLVSSPDNSSSESDEEEGLERAPVRVVTRFSRKPSSKDIITDAYENFYTDRDLKQDFFKTTFSLRNVDFTGSKSTLMSTSAMTAVRPLNQNTRAYNIKPMPITLLGNQDLMFPDSVLCNLDDQIITKLQQPLIYENLQTAVANPNLDAPLLPLKQSDMCLICIAFASWVLKTANPQAGDAWKAVLLANVSALSAIRYLRKYVKGETAAGDKKPNLKALN